MLRRHNLLRHTLNASAYCLARQQGKEQSVDLRRLAAAASQQIGL
jgi:hypothetical protein